MNKRVFSCGLGMMAVLHAGFCAAASGDDSVLDMREIQNGLVIPDEGYCDQPYVVITPDGKWVCTMTTGPGKEGQRGQHVVATISEDQGKTWSPLIDIEPSEGPEASWVVPLVTPSGRIYAFYSYNGDNVRELKGKAIRSDMMGWYVYKYSDTGGRTWSKKRYRLPMRITAADRNNDWGGEVQIFWGICKPIIWQDSVYFSFTKLGKYILDNGEGWMYASPNILKVSKPRKIKWELLPEGDHGIRTEPFGSTQEEHNIVALSDGSLYCIYRTTLGFPACSYSRNGGRTWPEPEAAPYSPGGRTLKTSRACPRIWRTGNGNFLFWYHNHSGKDFNGRNPAWISGGVEKNGCIHWSQPEILVYAQDVDIRMSYPDLIEQEGRYWVTETQKEVARVHAIDPGLLEGMWRQGVDKTVAQEGVLLDLDAQQAATGSVPMPALPDVAQGAGFAIECWVKLSTVEPGQKILENRDGQGAGWTLITAENGSVELQMNDGAVQSAWGSDPGVITPETVHHVVFVVDGGPKIITVVVDGVLCDGGSHRQYGWGRFDPKMHSGRAGELLCVAPKVNGSLLRVRLYGRYLRTSECVSNFLAGPDAHK
ncbi:MAG TPA: exo-alpha-sialidase [Candidatus Hydrogenedentes bacterium]|nr:exo-alpha-sialidase [Candidatus Hydrogenedentota bacterium]